MHKTHILVEYDADDGHMDILTLPAFKELSDGQQVEFLEGAKILLDGLLDSLSDVDLHGTRRDWRDWQ